MATAWVTGVLSQDKLDHIRHQELNLAIL
jgi:hypothetical protein